MCFRGKGKANKFQRILILFTIFEQASLTCHWTFNRRKAFVSVNLLWCVSILITNQRNACAPVKFKMEPPHNYSSTHAVTHKNIITRSTKQGWVSCDAMENNWKSSLETSTNTAEQSYYSVQVWIRPGESEVSLSKKNEVIKILVWYMKMNDFLFPEEFCLEEFLLHCWYSKCTYVCTVTHYLYDLT